MTRDEVIQAARAETQKRGWPWVEPLWIEEKRRFILCGRLYWRVTTNTLYAEIGENVHVEVDDKSGQVLSSDFSGTPNHSKSETGL